MAAQIITKKYGKSLSQIERYVRLSTFLNSGYSVGDIFGFANADLKKELSKILRYGFNEEQVPLFLEEKVKAYSIFGRMIGNGQADQPDFDINLAERSRLGFKTETIKSCPLNPEYKEIIRLECSGIVHKDRYASAKLSKPYKTAVQVLESKRLDPQMQEVSQRILLNILDLYKSKSGFQKKATQVLTDLNQTVNKVNSIKASVLKNKNSYNLSVSPLWANGFAQFERFREIAPVLKRALAERRIPQEVLEVMNVFDFEDLMFRAFPRTSNETVNIFEGSNAEQIKEIMSSAQNEQMVRLYMRSENIDDKFIEKKILEMKTYGTLSSIFGMHHIHGVCEAGSLPNIKDANDQSNKVLVSTDMHWFMHNVEKKDNKTGLITKLVPDKQYDIILGFTPLFRSESLKQQINNHILTNRQSIIIK